MKVQVLEILLDDAGQNPQAVYRSGQTVSAKVHLVLLEPVKCRSIDAKFIGKSEVYWTESRTETDSEGETTTETEVFQSTEVYINKSVTIYTPPDDGPTAELHPAGDFFYPISFQIPSKAPSSFEGGIGTIRYGITCNIDRPWSFDKFTQTMFTVIRDLDLNMEPAGLTGPFETSDNFDVECFQCFSCCGDIRVVLVLDRKGFVPGETVHVTGELINTSKTDIENVSLEIYQRITFYAEKNNYSTRVTSSAVLPGVNRGRRLPFNHDLLVNPLPSSRLDGCKNIEVQYCLRLNVDGGCCLSVVKECCELLIGTIPLRETAFSSAAPSGTSEIELALPTYAECMFGRQDVLGDKSKAEGTRRDIQAMWAPSYPVYSSPSRQA